MNLQMLIELQAGGPGSGRHPEGNGWKDEGHGVYSRPLPEKNGHEFGYNGHVIGRNYAKTQGRAVGGKLMNTYSKDYYFRHNPDEINKATGKPISDIDHFKKFAGFKRKEDAVNHLKSALQKHIGSELQAGGPGSGCNPAAGKCGRHAGPKKDPLAGFQNPKTASRSAKRAQKQQTKQARQAGFKPARVDKSFKTKQLPSIQQQQTFSPQEKVILTEDVVRGKKVSKAGEEAIVVNVLQQTPGQPQIYSVRLRNGHTEYLTHEQLARPALKGPQPQKPALQPLGGSKVKQSWTNADGSRYTEFFPKGGPKDSAPRDPFSTPHPLKGRFDRLTEDVYVKGSENRITSIYQAAAKSGVEGAGTTVFVHRYPGQQRVVVQEARTGQYNWQSSTLRQYEFGGKRSQVQSMKFTKTRYGISLKLPKMRF